MGLLFFLCVTLILGYNTADGHALSNKKVCIVGAGPCGLFFASHLLRQDSSVKVTVVDKAPHGGTTDAKAFGFGVGGRMRRSLETIPGMMEKVDAVSAPCAMASDRYLSIVRRLDLCECLRSHLNENYGSEAGDGRFRCQYDLDLSGEDLKSKYLKEYDLVIGGDGINSSVRKLLSERGVIKEERYAHGSIQWKALRIPPQTDIDPATFQPLAHPENLIAGAVLPRHPSGHTLLIFWRDGKENPGGIETVSELQGAIQAAVRGKLSKNRLLQRLNWGKNADKDGGKEVRVVLDDDEAERFLKCRPGKEHFLKVNKYHGITSSAGEATAPVALIGDAAHGMYSMLGQGCACGLQSSMMLSECLAENKTIEAALEEYSSKAVPEGHAITDLNLMSHLMAPTGQKYPSLSKMIGMPFLILNGLRGKMPVVRVNDDVSYQQVLKENQSAVAMSRRLWRRQRQSAGME